MYKSREKWTRQVQEKISLGKAYNFTHLSTANILHTSKTQQRGGVAKKYSSGKELPRKNLLFAILEQMTKHKISNAQWIVITRVRSSRYRLTFFDFFKTPLQLLRK